MKEDTKPTTVIAGHPMDTDDTAFSKNKATHRTKNKAGDTAEIPDRLPVITNRQYQHAMTLNKNDAAYLQLLSDNSRLDFKKGVLLLDDLPVTSKELKELFTK